VSCWKLTLEYQGTRYRGWQEQKNARTVQGALRVAAEEVLGAPVELGGSGRTDAGVHALAQVAHLKARRSLPPERILEGLNRLLPRDIHLLEVKPVPHRFHARHDARARYYLYQISRRRTAFLVPFVWWVKDRLDFRLMEIAAAQLDGLHDFRSFCERGPSPESSKVKIERVELAEVGDLILIRLGASHFLWKMVRRLVGVLVEVGRGALSAGELDRWLREESNQPAKWTAPPSGLFLEQVVYPGEKPPGALLPAIGFRQTP
jgi:tRNA pseudouridine38-40 synthase